MPTVTTTRPVWITSLEAREFILRPWKHQSYVARVFNCTCDTRTFERGTMHGLLEYEASDDSLNVVALHNEERGNGDFLSAIKALEAIAAVTGITLSVVQFNNRRLAFWFERRLSWRRSTSKRFGDHATFTP